MTIGAMVPFISFVSNPDKILEIELLRRTSDFFNLYQTEELFLFISFSFLIIIFLSGFIKIFSIKIINDFNATLKIELGKKLYKEILYRDYEYHLNTNSSQLISSQIQQLDSCLTVISQYMLLKSFCSKYFRNYYLFIIIDFRIVFFIISSSFLFYLIASISTKKYVDIYGKIIFETRKSYYKNCSGIIRFYKTDNSR